MFQKKNEVDEIDKQNTLPMHWVTLQSPINLPWGTHDQTSTKTIKYEVCPSHVGATKHEYDQQFCTVRHVMSICAWILFHNFFHTIEETQ